MCSFLLCYSHFIKAVLCDIIGARYFAEIKAYKYRREQDGFSTSWVVY